MIIIGYPCIGKSTLAAKENNIIDLESSNFNKEHTDWYEDYCNVAEDLSRQGFIVFVSCHSRVQEKLIHSPEDVWILAPEDTNEMKEYFIDKAKIRWIKSSLSKDKKAYERIRDYFDGDIIALKHSPIKQRMYLGYPEYDLKQVIKDMKHWNDKATEKDWLSAV